MYELARTDIYMLALAQKISVRMMKFDVVVTFFSLQTTIVHAAY